MTLNSCRFAAEAAFYNVRINGALCQIVNSTDFLSFFFKYANEFFADNFTFAFRSSYSCQFAVEALACVNAYEVNIELTAFTENSANLFALVFAQQTVVYKYAGQLLADSLSQHSGTNAGINTAGKRAQHLAVADSFFQLSNSLLYERIHFPGACTAANIVNKVAQHLGAVFGMQNLGMELYAIQFACFILSSSNRAVRSAGNNFEAGSCGFDIIVMAHPAYVFLR